MTYNSILCKAHRITIMTTNTTPKTAAELRYMTPYELAVYRQSISDTEPELDYTDYEGEEYEEDDGESDNGFGLITDITLGEDCRYNYR